MPENVENEQNGINEDQRAIENLLRMMNQEHAKEVRVNVSLSLLLKGYTIDELVDDLGYRDIVDNLSALLTAKVNPDKLALRLTREDVANHLDQLRAAGAHIDADSLTVELDGDYIVDHLAELLAAGADPNELVCQLDDKQIAYHLKKLLVYKVQINVDELASRLTPRPLADNLDQLRAAGVKIDVDRLLKKASPAMVRDNFGQFLRAGANPNKLVMRCKDKGAVGRYVSELLSVGVDINLLVSKLSSMGIEDNLSELLEAGVDIDLLVSKLSSGYIAYNLSELLEVGADIDGIVDNLPDDLVAGKLPALLAAGAKIEVEELVDKLDDADKRHDSVVIGLLQGGADPNKLFDKTRSASTVVRCLSEFVAAGVDKNKLGRRLEGMMRHPNGDLFFDYFLTSLDEIREFGIDAVTPEELMRELEEFKVRQLGWYRPRLAGQLDALLRFGVDPNRLARLVNGDQYFLNTCGWRDKLLAAGVDPDLL